MKARILGVLVYWIYRILSATWRLRLVEPPSLKEHLANHEPVIFAHWHGDELALLKLIGHYRIATLISTSKDGEIMMNVSTRMGAMSSRGSSTRGGVGGLVGLLRLVKEHKRNCSMAVDGPKGPIYEPKPGVFELSRLLKAPIYPGGVACDRAWHFPKSWNQTFLPKPFARVMIYWQEALPLVDKSVDPKSLVLKDELKIALHRSKESALKTLRQPF